MTEKQIRRADKPTNDERYLTRNDNEFRVLVTALEHFPNTGSRHIALELAQRMRDAPRDAHVVFESSEIKAPT